MKQALSDKGIQPTACVPGSCPTLGGRERIRPRPGAPAPTTLLVGFDSAWTSTNSDDGTYRELGLPRIVNVSFSSGKPNTCRRQPSYYSDRPLARSVPHDGWLVVASPVSRRYGGMQPANTARKEMFGEEAPVWRARFGGPADPLAPVADTRVFETYPVLAMIALGWTLPDSRSTGRLPKYNPGSEKDLLDLGLAARLRAGVSRVPRAWTRGDHPVDRRRRWNPGATQVPSGRPGCLLVLGGCVVRGRADRLPNGRRSSDRLHHRALRHRPSCGTRNPLQPDWSSAVGVGAAFPAADVTSPTRDGLDRYATLSETIW